MTDLQALNAAVAGLMASAGFPGPFILRRNAADAAYESYVFMLVLRAISQANGQVTLRSIVNPGGAPATFVFRGSPGYIFSDEFDYGYAACTLGGRPFEVHIDVRHFGSSRVLHEIDVSFIDGPEAVRCRARSEHPSSRRTHAAFECKFYGDTLGIALIRTYVGLTVDIGGLAISRFVSNASSQTIARYCTSPNVRARPRFTPNLFPGPVIGQLTQSEQQFVDSVEDDLRSWRV